jgi:RHS repeat-associated protein
MTAVATCAGDEISFCSPVTDTYEYDAYGNHWTVEGTTPNNMLYRGEEWDPDLSLVYLRARYMNPLTGRFVSMDPENGIITDPKTLHKYLYAEGDPVNLKDPTGKAGTGTATAGGDLGEYAGLALLAFAAVRTAQTVEQQNPGSVAASMHELGEELGCDFHFMACMISGLSGYNGSVYGSGRCQECKQACIKSDGIWPSSAPRTRGSVRCDYWNFK